MCIALIVRIHVWALCIVHYRTEYRGPDGLQAANGLNSGPLARMLGVQTKQNSVPLSSYDSRVRAESYGSSVQQHVIELLAYPVQ